MKLYSDFAQRRTFQIVGDVIALGILILGIVGAVTVSSAIAALSAVGQRVARSGSDFASAMTDIGDNLSGVPIIGDGIRAPFDGASNAGATLATAGSNLQQGVQTLAGLTGWTIAVLVVLVVGLAWVRPRLVGAVRRATDARLAASPDAWDLLAFRALAARGVQQVVDVHPDAVGAWRRGDEAVIHRLAALQVAASGVRLDAGTPRNEDRRASDGRPRR